MEPIKEKAKSTYCIVFNGVSLKSLYFVRDVGGQSSSLMSYFEVSHNTFIIRGIIILVLDA